MSLSRGGWGICLGAGWQGGFWQGLCEGSEVSSSCRTCFGACLGTDICGLVFVCQLVCQVSRQGSAAGQVG